MSSFIRFPGMEPVNLDHIFTFYVQDWDIRFIPANPNNMPIVWKFESYADANKVYNVIMYQHSRVLSVPHMDGNYSD